MKELGNSKDAGSSSSSTSGCPVAQDAKIDSSLSINTSSRGWGSWLGGWSAPRTSAADETMSASSTSSGSRSGSNGCPVSNPDQKQQQQPASWEEAARYAQTPHPDQNGVVLSTHRMISSIPRGTNTEDPTDRGPHHQATTATTTAQAAEEEVQKHSAHNWIYPSEQQFFNALRKKGWKDVQAEEIPTVLEIHNTVNEQTWKQVVRWEESMDRDITTATTGGGGGTNKSSDNIIETDLKLVRFQGRPKDLSPKAFLWSTILRQMDAPFDRHDWYVQKQPRHHVHEVPSSSTTTKGSNNKDGNDDDANDTEVISSSTSVFPIQRYVIDYYMIPPSRHDDPNMPPTPYVDARPALDSPRAWYMRASRWIQDELPGLTSEYRAWQARRPHYFDGSAPLSSAAAVK